MNSHRSLDFRPLDGATLGGYRLDSLIGRGGMGVVYRATSMSDGSVVALKVVASDLARDAAFISRFERETRIATSLSHPNVVPVIDGGSHEGALYLAMEYIEGDDLAAVLARHGALTADRAVAIVEQVAAALDHAHARGLVHRDVKPANVLVDRSNTAYLTDFGLSKYLADSGPTSTGEWFGTPGYVPPEQIQGQRVDARGDVYSLGAFLFHALSGHVPFQRALTGRRCRAARRPRRLLRRVPERGRSRAVRRALCDRASGFARKAVVDPT